MSEAFTSLPIVSTALAGTVAYLGFKAAKFGSRESFLPPGPPTTPVLGNLLDYPKEGPHHQFTKWAETYGPIYSLKLGNATVVVLNHPDIVKHVMDKNSVLSSDRPAYHFGEIVEGIDNDIVLARYSPKWRSLRRAAHEILSPQACRIHLAIQQAEATQLSYEILIDPKGFKNHLRRYANSTIMTLMYGNRIPRSSVPIAQEFWEMQAMWIDLTAPTSHPPVDLIPILKKVPERFARWKTLCKDVRHRQRSIYTRLLEQVESRLSRGEGNGCFMETVCSRAEEWNLDRENLLYFGTVMIAAGSDTTSVFLQTMILLLITHPEVQRKAQEEMDAVIGLERMPVVDDLERLPYINAVLTETHRFRPTAPLSVPHAASEDIVCDQYVIPKGAVIWQNTWGIFHDETIFENHDKFVPERFLGKPELAKIVEYAFGSGRRVCAGVHLAKNSIVINALNLIWGFNFTKAVGANGREIDLDLDNFDDGLVNTPKDFECTIKPRSTQHEAILRQEFRNTASSFQPFEQDLSAEDRAYAVDSRNRA